jgi:hypothetical protein
VTEDLILHNTSSVPLTYSLCVPDDGNDDPICYDVFTGYDSHSSFTDVPNGQIVVMDEGKKSGRSVQEFSIEPTSGKLSAHTSITFSIRFCPNYVNTYLKELAVKLMEVNEQDITVPITATYVLLKKIYCKL